MLNFILFCCIVLFVVAICFWFRARNHGLWRRILYKTHLWLGIISGIVLFIVCLTGMSLVFEGDINRFLERDKHFVSHPGKSVLNLDDLITKVEQNTNSKVVLVDINDRRSDTTMFYSMLTKTENIENNETKHERHSVDPYTGEILILGETFSPSGEFFGVVRRLHTSLFLPHPIGGIIVGSATLIFVIVALSGLCLWLPANFRNIGSWKNGFFIRFHKRKNQLIDDLHKTLGFYALIPVLLMALTGLVWSFQWFDNGVQIIFNAEPNTDIPAKSSLKNPDAKRLPIGFFHEKANKLLVLHKGGYRKIFLPEHDDDPVHIMEMAQCRNIAIRRIG
jgi:uncharacterized iron-regulated membrane protein